MFVTHKALLDEYYASVRNAGFAAEVPGYEVYYEYFAQI
jgi:hypothetical protein